MSDIWNTQKPSTASTAKRSIWGTQRSEPVRQANAQAANTLETHHVSKPLPVFSTIFADHVEFNKYMKQVILEHRQKNPETTASNVKAWHSSWMTHKENPAFQPLVDRVLSACTFVSAGYFQTQNLEFSIFNFFTHYVVSSTAKYSTCTPAVASFEYILTSILALATYQGNTV